METIVVDSGCGPYEGDAYVLGNIPHVCIRRSVVDSHDRPGEMDAYCSILPLKDVPAIFREVIDLRNMLPGF